MPLLAVLSDTAPRFSGQFFKTFLAVPSERRLIFTPFLFLCFHPQFFTSFLCALTLERSRKVPYYSLKRKSNCDFDPAAYGGRAEGAWSSARLAGLHTLPFPLSSSVLFSCRRSMKAPRINDYLHLTKLEENKFPSARRREGSGGNRSADWLIQEQWWNSL